MKKRSGEKCPNLQNSFDVKFFVQTQYGGRAKSFVTFDRVLPATSTLSPAKFLTDSFLRYSFLTANLLKAL